MKEFLRALNQPLIDITKVDWNHWWPLGVFLGNRVRFLGTMKIKFYSQRFHFCHYFFSTILLSISSHILDTLGSIFQFYGVLTLTNSFDLTPFRHILMLLLTLLHLQGSRSNRADNWLIYVAVISMWLWFPCRDFKALAVRSHQSLWLWIRSCDLQAKNEKGHDFKALAVRSYQSLWLWIRSCDLQAKN